MKTNVTILACTLPDWKVLVDTFKQFNGVSPTRELDKKQIPVGNPSSYAMVLEVFNNRAQAVGDLSKAYRSLDFIHVTFLVYFEDGDLVEYFCNLLELTHIQHGGREGNILICGSVRQYRDLVQSVLDQTQFDDVNIVLGKLVDCLKVLGFKDLFV